MRPSPWSIRTAADHRRDRADQRELWGAQDVLALSGVHPGITASQIGDTLTLSGTPAGRLPGGLRDVTYANGSDSPSTLLGP